MTITKAVKLLGLGGSLRIQLYQSAEKALDSQKKSFWLLFFLLSCGAFFLPFWWGVAETFGAVLVSWWVIYRTGIY